MNNVVSIEDMHISQICDILRIAQDIISGQTPVETLSKQWVANIFCEASTSTLCSFKMAEHLLGAKVIDITHNDSALLKGESLLDTVANLRAMGVCFFVIRHTQDNAIHSIVREFPDVHVINAGVGCYAHPTQALLDVLTMQQLKSDFSALKIAIVGDIVHSRVAASLVALLKKLNVVDVRLIGPTALLPDNYEDMTIISSSIEEGVRDCDVIYMLRYQKERMHISQQEKLPEYSDAFRLTNVALKHADSEAIVMHPGPVNLGAEIDIAMQNHPQLMVLAQAANFAAVKQAVLGYLSLQ